MYDCNGKRIWRKVSSTYRKRGTLFPGASPHNRKELFKKLFGNLISEPSDSAMGNKHSNGWQVKGLFFSSHCDFKKYVDSCSSTKIIRKVIFLTGFVSVSISHSLSPSPLLPLTTFCVKMRSVIRLGVTNAVTCFWPQRISLGYFRLVLYLSNAHRYLSAPFVSVLYRLTLNECILCYCKRIFMHLANMHTYTYIYVCMSRVMKSCKSLNAYLL